MTPARTASCGRSWISLGLLACFILAGALTAAHCHDDQHSSDECPACLWVQAVGGSQIPDVPAVAAPQESAASSLATDVTIQPTRLPVRLGPRSPPFALS